MMMSISIHSGSNSFPAWLCMPASCHLLCVTASCCVHSCTAVVCSWIWVVVPAVLCLRTWKGTDDGLLALPLDTSTRVGGSNYSIILILVQVRVRVLVAHIHTSMISYYSSSIHMIPKLGCSAALLLRRRFARATLRANRLLLLQVSYLYSYYSINTTCCSGYEADCSSFVLLTQRWYTYS